MTLISVLVLVLRHGGYFQAGQGRQITSGMGQGQELLNLRPKRRDRTGTSLEKGSHACVISQPFLQPVPRLLPRLHSLPGLLLKRENVGSLFPEMLPVSQPVPAPAAIPVLLQYYCLASLSTAMLVA